MTLTVADLAASPNALAPHYSGFRVSERMLLTGHSHQAWPDAGFEGQKRAWLDAAEHVDAKWDRAFAKWRRVAQGYAGLLGDDDGDITPGSNTHELVVRFLSALDLRRRPRIVTTDGEFHSVRRQVDRLAEEGIEVVKVPALPVEDTAERLAAAVDGRTACVMVSSVLFETGLIVPDLGAVARACRTVGAAFLVDAYHSLGVVPFSLPASDLQDAFVVGGGYKYLQLGEGNCFLRVPPGCELRPVVTGWFSEFAELAEDRAADRVRYGGGFARFAGSTYDPTSHYRAAEVLDFFDARELKASFLREVSQHQVGVLCDAFDGLDLDPAVVRRDPAVALEQRAGFLSLRTGRAEELCAALKERGVLTDSRGSVLRFGPAPYLSDAQIRAAMDALGEAARHVAGGPRGTRS